jgi:hypothetical protein
MGKGARVSKVPVLADVLYKYKTNQTAVRNATKGISAITAFRSLTCYSTT